MAQTSFLPDEQGRTDRPPLITSLGVLSFINCGFFTLMYAMGAMAMLAVQAMPVDEYKHMMDDQMARWAFPEDQRSYLAQAAELFHHSGLVLMLLLLARTVARLVGTIGMWRGRRMGFHIYAAAQLIGIFLPHLVLPLSMLGFAGPLCAVATTALYGTQVKRLS